MEAYALHVLLARILLQVQILLHALHALLDTPLQQRDQIPSVPAVSMTIFYPSI